jgi:thiol-disulfide isomerase/thioredoxin
MNRRTLLQILFGMLSASVFGAAVASEIGRQIDWTDVGLLDGRTLQADRLRGHVVVVEFWASFCPFCKRQNPELQRLYESERGRGLEMLTFSIDRDLAQARAYLAEHGYTFPAALASPANERWFGPSKGLPEVFVVDADGRIVFHEAGEMFPEDVRALARFAGR